MISADLRARLTWLMLTRATLATALGAGLIALHIWLGAPELWGAWLSAIGPILLGSYALNALSWPLVTRHIAPLKPLGYLHLVADVTTSALLMWHTGRLNSPLVFLPSVVVLFGALLFERTGAWVSATLGTGAFLLIAILEVSVMDFARLSDASETLRLLTLNTLIQIALVCVVATLASHLSERLRTAHLRLQVANQDLRTLRRLNERLLTRSQTGVLHLNARGEVLFANSAACELLKSEAQQLLGNPLFNRFPWLSPPFTQSDAVERHLYWELEAPQAPLEGERAHVTLACSLSQLSHHQEDTEDNEELSLEGSALLIQDITRAQQRREEARRRERLAELGTLAAQLAHELRNPLASMRSSLQLLERQLAPQEGLPMERRLLSIIDRETERLSQLTSSFLEVARPPAPQPSLTPLRPALEALLELTADTPHHASLTQGPSLSGVCVWVDPHQLQQILLNLIKNAHEAHDELEGLEGFEGAPLSVSLEVALDEEQVRVSVLDRGPGLPQDIERLFTPFTTSKAQGSGLGLALSRALANANHGALTAHEREGGGARFTLTLQQHPPEATDHPVSDTLIQAIRHDPTSAT